VNALFLVPRGAEAAAVRRAGGRVVELPAGARAADALPDVLAGERIIVTGLCGALAALLPQTVVVYEAVVDDERWFSCDASPAALLPGAHRVVGYTAGRVVTAAAQKRAYALRTGAGVVDMEGAPLAAALAARGIRFAMVRVVSDDARHDLPAIGDAIRPDGSLHAARVALAFARRPVSAARFVRDSLRALASLERTVRAIVTAPG
jgi:nucleoside phosphorylase